MAKKSLTTNYIYNMSYQVLVYIMPLFTIPYLSRVLGPENLGIYSYSHTVVSYFIIFSGLGIDFYGKRQIAIQQENKNLYRKTFVELFYIKTILFVFTLFIYYIIVLTKSKDYIIYAVLVIELMASYFDIIWFYQGLEDFKLITIRNYFVKILSVISIFLFVKTKDDIIYYILCISLTNLLGNISLWVKLFKYLIKIKFKELNLTQHFKLILTFFIPQIALSVYTMIDKIMLGNLSSIEEVGYYDQAQRIIQIIIVFITGISTVMMPRLCNLYARRENEKLNYYMNFSISSITFLVFPICFGISAVSDYFVPWFYGLGYEKVETLLKLFSIYLVFKSMSILLGSQLLISIGKQNQYTYGIIVGTVVNICLNIVLIKRFDSAGAVIAMIISELVVLVIECYYAKDYIYAINIIKLSKNYIISAIIMFIVIILLNHILINTLLMLSIKILIGIIIYFGLLFFIRDNFFNNLINKILSR